MTIVQKFDIIEENLVSSKYHRRRIFLIFVQRNLSLSILSIVLSKLWFGHEFRETPALNSRVLLI